MGTLDDADWADVDAAVDELGRPANEVLLPETVETRHQGCRTTEGSPTSERQSLHPRQSLVGALNLLEVLGGPALVGVVDLHKPPIGGSNLSHGGPRG